MLSVCWELGFGTHNLVFLLGTYMMRQSLTQHSIDCCVWGTTGQMTQLQFAIFVYIKAGDGFARSAGVLVQHLFMEMSEKTVTEALRKVSTVLRLASC